MSILFNCSKLMMEDSRMHCTQRHSICEAREVNAHLPGQMLINNLLLKLPTKSSSEIQMPEQMLISDLMLIDHSKALVSQMQCWR